MISKILAAALLLSFSSVLPAQTSAPSADATAVIPEALKAPTLEDNLRTLTNEIGGRVPGTPAMQKAMQWAFDAFKTAGGGKGGYEPFRISPSLAGGATPVRVGPPVRVPAPSGSPARTPPLP